MVEREVPVDLNRFKDSMAELASGVCLLTVQVEHGARDLGMTVTSLASASLDPPMVMVGIGRSTSMAPFLQPGANVGLSILADHQEQLAVSFSVKGRPSAGELLATAEHHRGPVTGSLLADGALAQLEGRVAQTIAAGDHVLVVIAVLAADAPDGTAPAGPASAGSASAGSASAGSASVGPASAGSAGASALLYHRRGYARSLP